MSRHIFLGVFIIISIKATISMRVKDSQRIMKSVLVDYNKDAVPRLNQHDKVGINVTFHLRNILNLEEETEILMSSGWMDLKWLDPRLAWNRSDFGDVESIYLARNNLWIPDVNVDNPADEYYIIGQTSDILHVNSDGHVSWLPGNVYRTKCNMDLTYFPFDVQVCDIVLTTWTYTNEELMFQNIRAPMESVQEQHGEWNITHISFNPGGFYKTVPNVVISVQMQRRSTFYILNIAVPCITATFINAFVFILPAESGEKITLATALFLSYAVFLSSITDDMPKTSTTISILGVFVAAQLMLSVLSILCTVVILRVHYRFKGGNVSTTKADLEKLQQISHKLDMLFFTFFLLLAILASGSLFLIMHLKTS